MTGAYFCSAVKVRQVRIFHAYAINRSKRNQRAEVRSVAEYANAGYETAVDSKLNIISGF